MLDLKERRDTLGRMMEYQQRYAKTQEQSANLMPFQVDLQGRQLEQVKEKISQAGKISEEEALKLLNANEREFYQYLYCLTKLTAKQPDSRTAICRNFSAIKFVREYILHVGTVY